MIIYPTIIIFLLLIAFGIVYRKAYILEAGIDPKVLDQKISKVDIAKNFSEAEADTKEDLEQNFQKAEDLFKKNQYISAEKWFIEAAKVNPRNDVIYARLGVIYIEQKNYKDAVEALEEAIELGPEVASRFFNLSFAKNALGDIREALGFAKRAARLEPKNEKYRKWLEELKSSPF